MRFSDLKNIFTNAYAAYSTLKCGKKLYQFTSAITAGSTSTTAEAGSIAVTSNDTGKNQLFISDGSYWQDYYGRESSNLTIATVATSAGNTDGHIMAPFTGKLVGVMFGAVDALAAHDSNYVTFSLANLNNSSAAMLLATDVNTSKATGGSALVANTKRDLSLHGTAGNLAVTAGDRLRFRVAATGTLGNTLTYPSITLIFQRTI